MLRLRSVIMMVCLFLALEAVPAGGDVYAGPRTRALTLNLVSGPNLRVSHVKDSWLARCATKATFTSRDDFRLAHPVLHRFWVHAPSHGRQGALRYVVAEDIHGRRLSSTRWRGTFTASVVIRRAGRVVDRCRTGVRPWSATTPSGQLNVASDPGDYIGEGQSYRYVAPGQTIIASPVVHNVLEFQSGGFELYFAAGSDRRVRPGIYRNARRWPFNGRHPGLTITASDRGCNVDEGSFTVAEIRLAGTRVISFKASFVQHCEDGPTALRGTLVYHR